MTKPPAGFPDTATMSIPEAAHWLGVGRDAAYVAAKNGTLPTIRIGRQLLRVPTATLARMLGFDPDDPS
jgi:excisionase family DNA binding protein